MPQLSRAGQRSEGAWTLRSGRSGAQLASQLMEIYTGEWGSSPEQLETGPHTQEREGDKTE